MNTNKTTQSSFDGGFNLPIHDQVQQVRMQDEMARSMKTDLPTTKVRGEIKHVDLAVVRTDGGTHSRSVVDQRVVDDYAMAMQRGDEFPAIVLFFDGTAYWLADGFHTVSAAWRAQLDVVKAEVRLGTARDAKLFSAQANAKHGLRRTNVDKRCAVLLVLNDPEWRLWTDRDIAKHCGVDNAFVSNLRDELIERARANQNQVVDGQHNTIEEGALGQVSAPPTTVIPDDTLDLVRGTVVADNLDEVKALALRSLQRQKQIIKVITSGVKSTVLDADRELKKRRSEAKKKERLDAFRNSGFTCSEFVNGDCLKELNSTHLKPKSVRLLLSDVPYGMGLKNKQRVASVDWEPIAGDKNLKEALQLLEDMLGAIDPFMADESHALIFTHWRFQQEFRETITAAGYKVRNVLIWVKEMYGVGYTGDFGPQYECIIHAVRGGATITPRLGNTFVIPRENVTTHVCEKPTELLRQLINCTTQPGELVVDPFAGTGATLVAAAQSGRHYFGVELESSYHEEGLARLHALQPAVATNTYQERESQITVAVPAESTQLPFAA